MLDLVSNTEQMLDIQNMVEEMKKNKIFGAKKYTAQFIINFIREKTPFDYKAIRAWGRDAANHNSIRRHIYPFNQKSTLSLCPEIQICVIDKSVIRLPMTIHYCSNDEAIDSLTV